MNNSVTNVPEKGEIKNHPAIKLAYQMGKNV